MAVFPASDGSGRDQRERNSTRSEIPMKWRLFPRCNRWIVLPLAGLFVVGLALLPLLVGKEPRWKILLVGVDGGSWDLLQTYRSQGKLPNFSRLIDGGAAGHLASLLWTRSLSGQRGYWSPILWSTLATGKLPNKHGIEDFVMPTARYLRFWLAPVRGKPATLRLPPVPGDRLRLAFRGRAPDRVKRQSVRVRLKGQPLVEMEFGAVDAVRWADLDSPGGWLEPELQLDCPGAGQLMGRRTLCLDLSMIRLFDGDGGALYDFHPMKDRSKMGDGWLWERPKERIPAASFHRRARAFWRIAGDEGRPVGVVGWWTTWPAEPLNGFVYSYLLGVHGARATGSARGWFDKFQGLAYPPGELDMARKLYMPMDSLDGEISERFLDLSRCDCVSDSQARMLREFYWEDRYFMKLALDLRTRHPNLDLFTVYLRAIDATGHMFLHFSSNKEALAECESDGCDVDALSRLVENAYRFTDEQLGRLLEQSDEKTVTIIVTDHGQVPAKRHGNHADNGFIILSGGPIARRILPSSNLVDLTPTLLYLLDLPMGADMDGHVLTEAMEPDYLVEHPVRFVPSYERPFDVLEKEELDATEIMDEETERMRALGYVE